MDFGTRKVLIGVGLSAALIADAIAWRSGLPYKLALGYLSAAITLTGYLIYISQMYPAAGGTAKKPEPLSWVLFGFLTAAGWVVQVAQGGAAGSWCLGLTAFACFVIAVWSYLKFTWSFDRWHTLTAVGAIFLFLFSILTREHKAFATTSALCATAADLLSYGPTFRRAWSKPHEESATNFAFNSVKCVPALLALDTYSVATMVYLAMLTVVNGGFAIFLLLWRKDHIRALVRSFSRSLIEDLIKIVPNKWPY